MALKKGVSAGIGLFIAFIGLQGANLVVNDDSTLLTYVKFVGDFHTIGIGALLALIGLFIIVVLHHKNIKGSILIGILAGYLAGKIVRGGGMGLLVNLIVGIIGGVLGGWLFGIMGIWTTGVIGSLITATVGAIVLLAIVSLFSKRNS